ncbi:MAG: selenocysteine-specific translation elongation factor [Deltaproteobacteria bacterium]
MNAIVGTAGHIDHGKSVLVRALTGIETDRLPQEKERGISIELGFAYMDAPGGERIGVVDVPGHERFVRQMLAGAQGFDLVLLVVAADDGVMPQTEEHFEIVHLLGISNGIFVITKCDLVDEGRVEEVRSEIEVLAFGTPLEGAEVLAVAANEGRGIDELRQAILDKLDARAVTAAAGPFHMPVDRAFVLKGHGVVVTGTASAGTVGSGDALEIAPGGRMARVREVHVHGVAVERASAGQRVALNLSGVDRDQVGRGDTVASPGLDAESGLFAARVEIRPAAARPVASHDSVRLYIGTDDVLGTIVWLGGDSEVAPGEFSHAQLRLRRPTVVLPGQRFVLRDESAQRTIGGGMVLLPHVSRRRSAGDEDLLATLATGMSHQRIGAALGLCRGLGMPGDRLALIARTTAEEIHALVESGVVIGLPSGPDPVLLSRADRYAACVSDLLDTVAGFHRSNSSAPGIESERLRSSLAGRDWELDDTAMRLLIDGLVDRERLIKKSGRLAHPDHRSSLGEGDEEIATQVLGEVREGSASPPSCKNLADLVSVDLRKLNEIVSVLVERGAVIRVSPELVFSSEAVSQIESRLRDHLAEHGEVTAAGFRDLISASRKYSIPLLDYFDARGLTMRSGDVRRLRPAPAGAV